MNNKRMYIICICGCFIIKLFCNLFWYLEPRETMIKLHSDNLKEGTVNSFAQISSDILAEV